MSKAEKRSKLEIRYAELQAENERLKRIVKEWTVAFDDVKKECEIYRRQRNEEVNMNRNNSEYISKLEKENHELKDKLRELQDETC